MVFHLLETLRFFVLIVILIILFIVFDTIKRTKGRFNLGSKAMFIAFSLLFILEILGHFSILRSLIKNFELLDELLEGIFVTVMLVTVFIINQKVKKVNHGNKKKKSGKMKG